MSRNYSKLKLLIYQIEKAALGISQLPKSTEECDGSSAQALHLSVQINTDEERRPLIEPVSADVSNHLFTNALDEQLSIIIHFYCKQETILKNQVESLLQDVNQCERIEDSLIHQNDEQIPGDCSDYSKHLSRQKRSRALSDTYVNSITDESVSSPSSPTRMETVGSLIWKSPHLKEQRKKFKILATDLYVTLNNLKAFVEMNYTGFSKILKKYEKVTGFKLKSIYIPSKVDSAYPFKNHTRAILAKMIDKVTSMYAKVATENKIDLATMQLNGHLRDKLVWERNSIWKDMIEKERRTTAVVVEQEADLSIESFVTMSKLGILGIEVSLPVMSSRFVKFLLAASVLFVIANANIFKSVEQNNCFAILIFSSILWSAEIIPLFVTSILIPALVVILRVQRDLVRTENGSPSYIRLDAKASAKRVFSEMFSPVIMLLLGGFSLAAALSKHHIAKRMAGFVLAKAGSKPRSVILANIFVSTFASMWISNVAAPVLCFSLITPILRNLPHRSPYAKSLIMGIALAANVGGMASPISSPQNVIAMGNMNPSVSWISWFMIALPVCLVVDIIIWILLLVIYKPSNFETSPPEIFQSHKDRALDTSQIFVLSVTILTIGLWCLEASIEGMVGDMGVIAILPMVLFFGTGILNKDDFNNFLWTVVMLAMGGITLGKAVQSSGLLNEITSIIVPYLSTLSVFDCMLVVTLTVLLCTTFVSHTVGALIILPVVAEIGAQLPDPRPRTLVMAAALMCSGAMGLPVSSFPNMNAISLEDTTGQPWLSVHDFLRVGIVSSCIAYAAIISIGYGIMFMIDFN